MGDENLRGSPVEVKSSGNKKLIIGVIAVVIIGVLIGVYFMFSGGDSGSGSSESGSIPTKISDCEGSSSGLGDLKEGDGGEELEGAISGFFERMSCYVEVAKYQKDEAICNEIPNTLNGDDIRWLCYSEVAILKDDTSVCQNAPEETTRQCCSVKTAGVIPDPALCEGIEDLNSICTRETCYTSIGSLTNDKSYCEKIEQIYENEESRGDMCYRHVALASKNVALCQEIDDGSWHGICVRDTSLALAEDGDYEGCLEYPGGFLANFKRLDCYIKAAIALDDISICEKAIFISSIDYINPEDKIDDRSQRCQDSVAKEMDNPELCLVDYEFEDCIVDIAIDLNDDSFCDYISEEGSSAEACKEKVEKSLKCGEIGDPYYYRCIENIK